MITPANNATNETANATNETTNATNSTTNTTVEPPEPDFDYTCFNCIYNKLSWDTVGCFNHTKNKTRVNSNTVNTFAGCVVAGQNVTNNSYAFDLEDLRNITANNETFNVSYKCSQKGEEIFVAISNPLMDVNSLNITVATEANLTDLNITDATDAFISVICSGDSNCQT